MSASLTHLLRRPLVTERSTLLKAQNKYVFEVEPHATKGQIREAVRAAFNVDVLAVNTLARPGKRRRRMGPRGGQEPARKKAVVTIKPGQEIKFAEPSA